MYKLTATAWRDRLATSWEEVAEIASEWLVYDNAMLVHFPTGEVYHLGRTDFPLYKKPPREVRRWKRAVRLALEGEPVVWRNRWGDAIYISGGFLEPAD